jgi:hypothetical protein
MTKREREYFYWRKVLRVKELTREYIQQQKQVPDSLMAKVAPEMFEEFPNGKWEPPGEVERAFIMYDHLGKPHFYPIK